RERPGHRAAGRALQRLAERLEQGIVRLLSSEALDALTARGPQLRSRRAALEEDVDERRLPDPGLAGDEHDLPLPCERLVEAPAEQGHSRGGAGDRPLGKSALRR